jgi:hypothetical protein
MTTDMLCVVLRNRIPVRNASEPLHRVIQPRAGLKRRQFHQELITKGTESLQLADVLA